MNGLRRVAALSAVLALALLACGDERLVGLRDEVRPSAERIDFGRGLVGSSVERTLTLTNASRAELEIRMNLAAPFRSRIVDTKVPAGAELPVALSFEPTSAGVQPGSLEIHVGADVLTVELTGEGVDASECGDVPPCRIASIDAETGACSFTNAPDGSACHSACVDQGTCFLGACVGNSTSCDDGDACTQDGCSTEGGCTHAPITCAPPDDPCKAAACDPVTGCTVVDVADGVSCGATDCITAHVCIAGACVVRPAVDGLECAPASPCGGPSTCRSGACVAPPPTGMTKLWSYVPAPGRLLRSNGPAQDDDGNLYAYEGGQSWEDSGAELVSWTKDGVLRFRTPAPASVGVWLAVDDDLDRVYVSNDEVSAFTRAGVPVWTTSFATELGGVYASQNVLTVAPDEGLLLVWRTQGGSGNQTSWLVAIDAATGKRRWSRKYPGVGWFISRDAQGDVLAGWYPSNALMIQPVDTVDVKTGAVLSTGPALFTQAWTATARMAEGGFGSAVLDGDGQVLFPISQSANLGQIGRSHVAWLDDAAAGRTVVIASLDDGAMTSTQMDWYGDGVNLFFAEQDVVVLAGGGTSVSAGRVGAIGPDGSVRFDCEVPKIFPISFELGDERLIVRGGYADGWGFDVYALPGISVARWGYTGPNGGPGLGGPRHWRPQEPGR